MFHAIERRVYTTSTALLTITTVVEQNRLLDGMLKIIQENDRNTGLPICNPQTCPAMTAGK